MSLKKVKSNYWSCSKFADWLRGTPTLSSGTAEEWNNWEKTAKEKPFRYWLAEEGLGYLQNFITWPANRIKAMRCYANNRWLAKSHALTSCLKRGKWYDFDTRLLHAVFDELVNFVEIELAWVFIISSEKESNKYRILWYHSRRCPKAGIAYLKWASELKVDEDLADKNDPSYGQLTPQALDALETLKLYVWWKEKRPKRVDPSKASGWSDYCEEIRDSKACSNGLPYNFISNKMDEEDKKRSRHILSIYQKIENEQEEEDTAMLIRLVKIRQSLWT